MKKICFLFAAMILFVSCSSDDDNGAGSDLNKNRELWQSKQFKNYSLNERLSCYCGGPLEWEIYVVNGTKDTVTFDTSGILSENLEEVKEFIFNSSRTVDEAFDFIEELLNKDVASLSIEYNKTYGYPSLISVDYSFEIADDEFAYVYSNLKIEN